MDTACVTTPFGRRAMTLAMLAKQREAETHVPAVRRNKWKLFRAICEARQQLDISDRSLTVLDALLSFYPADELAAENGLIVFPSNAQLSIRARGMTAATLRRHLAALVDAGLVLRKDSPNGKRYARRSRGGGISEAFGFSLAPLLSRAQEIEAAAGRVNADRELFQSVREKISLCRREITKLIHLAQEDQIEGDWAELHDRFRSFLSQLPRRPALSQLQELLSRLSDLRTRIINLLEDHDNLQYMRANESQNARHIQDSQTYSQFEYENEAAPAMAQTAPSEIPPSTNGTAQSDATKSIGQEVTTQTVDLGLVLRACPEIKHYSPGGSIRTWRDFVAASVTLATMMQVKRHTFQAACRAMGPENTAVAIACIYERGGNINSAGAYLTDLGRRAGLKQFSVKPMVRALLQKNNRHA